MERLVAWILWTFIATMVFEHQWHRYGMHRSLPWCHQFFLRHAIQHHHEGRNDVSIAIPVWYQIFILSPLWGPVLYLDWVGGLVLVTSQVGYTIIWTALHREFHGLGSGWIMKLPGYTILREHHLEHHRRPRHNFGTLFGPLPDRLFGTLSKGNL